MVPPDLEEQAVAALWDSGCLGVQVLAAGRRPRLTLDAYYPGKAGRRRLGGRLRSALRQAGLAGKARPALSMVGAGRWVERWQESLRPMAVGRFLIVPEGSRPSKPGGKRHTIHVRFGQAFGTGEHASTRMCLRLLERHLVPDRSVADLGTGSGILAIAASRLGASRVLAVDSDDVALAVARDNLKDNALLSRIELRPIDALEGCRLGPFDLVLVNIGAATIEGILPQLSTALLRGGRAILAGLLVEDEGRLLRAAGALDLRLIDRRRRRPWSALVLIKSLSSHLRK